MCASTILQDVMVGVELVSSCGISSGVVSPPGPSITSQVCDGIPVDEVIRGYPRAQRSAASVLVDDSNAVAAPGSHFYDVPIDLNTRRVLHLNLGIPEPDC